MLAMWLLRDASKDAMGAPETMLMAFRNEAAIQFTTPSLSWLAEQVLNKIVGTPAKPGFLDETLLPHETDRG